MSKHCFPALPVGLHCACWCRRARTDDRPAQHIPSGTGARALTPGCATHQSPGYRTQAPIILQKIISYFLSKNDQTSKAKFEIPPI